MSLITMALTSKTNKDIFLYNNNKVKDWIEEDISSVTYESVDELLNYLKSNYTTVNFYRLKMAKTYAGTFVKPKEIYHNVMDHESDPNVIFVTKRDGEKRLISVKPKLPIEFGAYNANYKRSTIPLLLYRDLSDNVQIINP